VFVQTLNRNVDLVFMIDNSPGMLPMQQLLTTNVPAFMNVLKMLPGGLPNLHVGVVSSSMGAGRWANVPGCEPQPLRNDQGVFHYTGVNPPGCMGPAGSYIITDAAGGNFTGDISAVFSCIALLGDSGCGFEHQFRSVQVALERSFDPSDPENGGFLRDDAYLAVIMLTNEDDCSVPPDSDLLDPRQTHVSDPLGGLQTGYRCNEFGHLCDDPNNPGGPKVPPPHTVARDTTLTGCQSAEDGRLVRVSDFVAFLKQVKQDPDNQIFVAALAGIPDARPDSYTVELRPNIQTADGARESQPAIKHSCTGGADVFADPGVRIKQWTDAFGEHGIIRNICTGDFAGAMYEIAIALSRVIGPQCFKETVASKEDGTPCAPGGGCTPDCQVALQRRSSSGIIEVPIPLCSGGSGTAANPCWQIVRGATCAQELQVCYDAACTTAGQPPDAVNVAVACALGS